MGAPIPFIGFEPPDDPGRLPVLYAGSGGGVGGPEPRPIRGVAIAFGQAWNAEEPAWQNLQEIGQFQS